MTIDSTATRSRRSLLFSGLGALGAAVGITLARTSPVHADDPDDVTLGAANTAPTTTQIQNTGDSQTAIRGVGTTGPGVTGRSRDHHGTQGFSDHFTGVWGQSTFDYGVIGFAPTGARAGALGYSAGNKTGVYGLSKGDDEVPRTTPDETGVFGRAVGGTGAVGVRGESGSGRGGYFIGNVAQLRLKPSSARSHPTAGLAGDLFLDSSRRLWLCKGGSTWVRLDT